MSQSTGFYLARLVVGILWFVAIIGAGIGVFLFVTNYQTPVIVPFVFALTVIPYCVARAAGEIFNLFK